MSDELAILRFGELDRAAIESQEEDIREQIIEDLSRLINFVSEATIVPLSNFAGTSAETRAWNLYHLGEGVNEAFPITFLTKGKPADKTAWLGGVQVSIPDWFFELAQGRVPNSTVLHVRGSRKNIQTADGAVDIWNGPLGDYPGFDIPNIPLFISSTDAGDTQTIKVTGLDQNGDIQVASASLNGQNQVEVGSSLQWTHIYEAFNNSSTPFAGTVYVAATDAAPGGVPNSNKVGAILEPVHQETQMTFLEIPSGHSGFLLSWFHNVQYSSATERAADVGFMIRNPGKVFRCHEVVPRVYTVPRKYPAGTQFKVRASEVASDGVEIAAGYDVVLVKD